MADNKSEIKLHFESEKFFQTGDDVISALPFIVLGFAIGYIALRYMGLMNGNSLLSTWAPYMMTACLGAAICTIYMLNEGRTLRELFMASTFKKQYPYGLALRSDVNGVIEAAKLKKHDDETYFFVDPKARMPVIIDNPKTDFAVQRHVLDGIEVVLVSSNDALAQKVKSNDATDMLLREVYSTRPTTERLYRYETDAQGNYVVVNGEYKRTVFAEQEVMVPMYPQMSKIPRENVQKIADMIFDAPDKNALYTLALKSVVMESTIYEVPETKREPMFDEKTLPVLDAENKPVLDEAGKPRMETKREPVFDENGVQKYVEKPVVDENGSIVFRYALPGEVEEVKKQNARDLVQEAMAIRVKLAVPNTPSPRTLLNILYGFVDRPWMKGESDNIMVQARNQVNDETLTKKQNERKTDDNTVYLIGGAVAFVIVGSALKMMGVW